MLLSTDSAIQTELIEAAQAGDGAAIEALLLHYQPTVTRFARKYCATPQDVEDAVQETLLIASRRMGSLRVSAAFVSWLFTIVRNYCFRLLSGNRFRIDLEYVGELASAEGNPEPFAILRQDITRALGQLPISYREVLILRDVQELSAMETAERLGITVEAVKARLHRARKAMRTELVQWQD